MGQLHYRPLDKQSMHSTQSYLSLVAFDILEAKARDRPLKTSQRLVRPTLYTRACKEWSSELLVGRRVDTRIQHNLVFDGAHCFVAPYQSCCNISIAWERKHVIKLSIAVHLSALNCTTCPLMCLKSLHE
ncbi:hypothetical protein Peur_048779 [Populus x canadensis]